MNAHIPARMVAALAAKRAGSFLRGWYDGVKRYREINGSVIPGCAINPADDVEAFAASEAAVAYMIGLERGKQ